MEGSKATPEGGDSPQGRSCDLAGVVSAVREALPTLQHAEMLFDLVAERLGESATVESAGDGAVRRLFQRDPSGSGDIVPWPLLELARGRRLTRANPEIWPPGEALARGIPRRAHSSLSSYGGEFSIHDGRQSIRIVYGKDARQLGMVRSPVVDSFTGLVASGSRTRLSGIERVAEWASSVDLGRHGSLRVIYTDGDRGGMRGCWTNGLATARGVLFDEMLPETSGWVMADWSNGGIRAFGASREEALEAWRAECERQPGSCGMSLMYSPWPQPDVLSWEEAVVLPAAQGWVMEFVGPCPDPYLPPLRGGPRAGVAIQVAAQPTKPHPWGRWVRLLGTYGATHPALVREDPQGLTLVGAKLAAILDLDTVDERLDAVSLRELHSICEEEQMCMTTTYRLTNDRTRELVPATVTARTGADLGGAGELDGEELSWRVLRQEWGEPMFPQMCP